MYGIYNRNGIFLAIIFIYSPAAIMAINIMIALWLFGCANTISIAMECVTFDVINGVIVCHSVELLKSNGCVL